VDRIKPRPAVEAFVLALMEATTNLGADGPATTASLPPGEAGDGAGTDATAD
jgi:hypothetical protein